MTTAARAALAANLSARAKDLADALNGLAAEAFNAASLHPRDPSDEALTRAHHAMATAAAIVTGVADGEKRLDTELLGDLLVLLSDEEALAAVGLIVRRIAAGAS